MLFAIARYASLENILSLSDPSDVYPSARSYFSTNIKEIISTLMQTYSFGPGGYLIINGPLWSLSYEVGFYLIAGCAMCVCYGESISNKFVSSVFLLVMMLSIFYLKKFLFVYFFLFWVLGIIIFWCLKYTTSNKTACLYFLSATLPMNILIYPFQSSEVSLLDFNMSILIGLLVILATKIKYQLFPRFSSYANSTYSLYLLHFPLLLFFYGLIRPIRETHTFLYLMMSSIFSIFIIPMCHIISKKLENRKYWESIIIKGIEKSLNILIIIKRQIIRIV